MERTAEVAEVAEVNAEREEAVQFSPAFPLITEHPALLLLLDKPFVIRKFVIRHSAVKLALHRSITFWSGILVIAFLCWACWDSTRAQIYAVYGGCEVRNRNCGVAIGSLEDYKIQPARAGRRELDPLPASPASDPDDPFAGPQFTKRPGLRITWPRYFRLMEGEDTDAAYRRFFGDEEYQRDDDPANELGMLFLDVIMLGVPGDWQLYLPHWILLSAFVPLWLALLVWRARHRKRKVGEG